MRAGGGGGEGGECQVLGLLFFGQNQRGRGLLFEKSPCVRFYGGRIGNAIN